MNEFPKSSSVKTEVSFQPGQLADANYWRGRDFPIAGEDTSKGTEAGSDGLVAQSDKQKAPRLNASDGYGPTVKGKEGKAFPPAHNSKSSTDEQATFAGQRSEVGVSLVSGQITSSDNHRLVPVPQNSNDGQVRPLVKFRKATSDIRENRI